MKNFFFLCIAILIINANSFSQTNTLLTHEFRGVWIATVNNIDWPSTRTLPVDSQKAEFIKIIQMHKQNGINAIIMQVRPAGDAFFPSQYEPWSVFLNGTQGLPPTPYYDPLAFMIDECHKLNMEFHAWINPYRAVFKYKENPVAPAHLTKIKPNWFVTYGDHKYFNPALPEVRQHVVRVVKDLIDRYDIDGIHMDDYFYPYKVKETRKDRKGNKYTVVLDFPDQSSYLKYGNGLSKDDWRRSNCDLIIKNIWDLVYSHPHRVKFGVSPFGVWKTLAQDSLGSNTTGAGNNYYELYADIRKWLQNGWMDYCVPQLYWEINHPLCDYYTLLDWWNKNSFGRNLYIGHGLYRAGGKGWTTPDEIPNQIKALRSYNTTHGSVYFSSKNFEKNPFGWNDSLRNNYYATPALPPIIPWIDNEMPQNPTITVNQNMVSITYNGLKQIKGYMVIAGESLELATVRTIIYQQNTSFAIDQYIGEKVFVASVSKNNVLSNWVAVN